MSRPARTRSIKRLSSIKDEPADGTINASSSSGEYSSDDSDSVQLEEGSDDNRAPAINKKLSKKAKKVPAKKVPVQKPLPSRASIAVLAHNPEDDINAGREDLARVDQGVIARIVKALNLANHPGTGEQEAKAALRMAQKLMSQHSVTQAAVLSTVEDNEERLQKAGMSTVTVRSEAGKRLFLSTWSVSACQAMDTCFNCKSYTTSYDNDRIDFIFYGLAEQTVAAAFAFEMVYNLIMIWSRDNKDAKGKHQKNAYCHGIADGLYKFAKEGKRREEEEAQEKEQKRLEMKKREEEKERQRQIERLEGPSSNAQPDMSVKSERSGSDAINDDKSNKENRKPKTEDPGNERNKDRRPKVEEVDDEDMLKASSSSAPSLKPECTLPSHLFDLSPASQASSSSATVVNHWDSLSTPDMNVDVEDEYFAFANYGDHETNGVHGGEGNDSDDEDLVHPDFHDSDVDLDLADSNTDKKPINAGLKDSKHEASNDAGATTLPTLKPDPDIDLPIKTEGENALEDESPWDSAGQLVAFRETASTLADDYLKSEGVELKKGRKRAALTFKDKDAKESYKRGREDAKKIDVKRRRITEKETDVVY